MVRKEVSQTAEERIRSLDEIRQITRELIDIQMDGCSEEELSDKQRLLNVKYDRLRLKTVWKPITIQKLNRK